MQDRDFPLVDPRPVGISRSTFVAVFRVTRVKEYPKDEFPTDVVYGDLDGRTALISCYDDNIVAFADHVAARPTSPA